MNDISVVMVFLGGLASFFSPCVLPMVPGYITYLAGASAFDGHGGTVDKGSVFIRALGFVAGFSLIFILMGATASALGQFFRENQDIIQKTGAILVIVFGIHMTGLIKIPFLYREMRFHNQGGNKKHGIISAVLLGMAFGGGWTPCIGPILSSVLVYASAQETLGFGVYLLFIYSLGLALPFLMTAWALEWMSKFFDRIKPYLGHISIVSGIILIGLGALLFMDKLDFLSNLFPFS